MTEYRRLVKISAIATCVIGVGGAIWLNLGPVRFGPFSAQAASTFLMPLVWTALFVERSLEVFLTPWRGGNSDDIQERITQLTGAEGMATELAAAKIELVTYKSATRGVAFSLGFSLGIVSAMFGIRGFLAFVDPGSLAGVSLVQRTVLGALDVLLSGALIAGGSEGLHRVISVFMAYVDMASAKAKAV